MIPIMVYAGGKISTGSMGVDYDNQPRFSFLGDEVIRFDDVRTMIFRRLRLLERRYFISISARYNIGGASAYYFCLIPIRDEVEWQMIFQMASVEMNWRAIELYVEVFSNDNVGLISNSLPEINNNIEDNIVPININNQNIDLNHQVFNPVEQSPQFEQAIGNLDPNPFDSPIVHLPMIYDNIEDEDTQNEDVDAMEEEGNDDDGDFIPFACEGWEVGEDY
jgi:hypothetical protein